MLSKHAIVSLSLLQGAIHEATGGGFAGPLHLISKLLLAKPFLGSGCERHRVLKRTRSSTDATHLILEEDGRTSTADREPRMVELSCMSTQGHSVSTLHQHRALQRHSLLVRRIIRIDLFMRTYIVGARDSPIDREVELVDDLL